MKVLLETMYFLFKSYNCCCSGYIAVAAAALGIWLLLLWVYCCYAAAVSLGYMAAVAAVGALGYMTAAAAA
jgi:hypothetical protein